MALARGVVETVHILRTSPLVIASAMTSAASVVGCAPPARAPAEPDPRPRVEAPVATPPPERDLLLPMLDEYVVTEGCASVEHGAWRLSRELSEPDPRPLPRAGDLVVLEEGRHCRAGRVRRVELELTRTVDPHDVKRCEAYRVESPCRGDFAVAGHGVDARVQARGPAALGAFVSGFPYEEPPEPQRLPPMPDFGTDFEARDQWVQEHSVAQGPPPPSPFALEVRGSSATVIQGPRSVEVREHGAVVLSAPTYADYFVSVGEVFYARLGDGTVLRLDPAPAARVLEPWVVERADPSSP